MRYEPSNHKGRKKLVEEIIKQRNKLVKAGYTVEENAYAEPFYKEIKLDKDVFENLLIAINDMKNVVEKTCDKFAKK